MVITRHDERLAGGRLSVSLAPGCARDEALNLARTLAEANTRSDGPRAFGAQTAWVKAAPLSVSGARRHGRRAWLGLAAPRRAELQHLAWLEARLFRVPRPLFAATLRRGGSLVHQALATELVPDAAPYDVHDAQLAVSGDDRARRALAEELGRELGRMHALGFLHADLYPRNVLVAPPEHTDPMGRRLVWLDCWAGGPGHRDGAWSRPLARDLGTWFTTAADAWPEALQAACLAAYDAAREANGRPVADLGRLLAGLVRERRRELRRLERDPARLRGRAFPRAGFDPSNLVDVAARRFRSR